MEHGTGAYHPPQNRRVLQEEAHARAAADARESAEAELEALSERVRELEEREEDRAALEGEVRSLQSALAVAQEEHARGKVRDELMLLSY